MIEGRPGIDFEPLADLPHRRGIASVSDEFSDEVKYLFLAGRQSHPSHDHLVLENRIAHSVSAEAINIVHGRTFNFLDP